MPADAQPHRSPDRYSGLTETAQPRARSYPRFLAFSTLGTLLPGVGLIAAGRKRSGTVVLVAFLLGGAAVGAYAVRAGTGGLVRLGTDPDRIRLIAFGLIAVATVWLLVAIVSFYLLDPGGLSAGRRFGAAVMVIVVASAVATPMGIGSHYAFTQRGFIESVFPDDRNQFSLTIPEEATDEDPWAGRGRVNLLVLGSDGTPGRPGVRTDTIMVASVDAQSGDTALFSLPRNLQHTPFPEGPLRDAYPSGFRGEPASEHWLNAIYNNVPHQFPDYFEGIDDPGAEAVKLAVGEALGLEIDYYLMVNLDGFKAIVDALGGVVIDVPYRIPMGTQATSWGTCTPARAWIEEGEQQRLDGGKALWFARARCGPPPVNDDYERMRRQRCLIGAIAEQANPFTLITRYLHLESAVRDNFSTDINKRRLEDFAELALRVQDAEIRSLPFTNKVIDYGNPDFDLIQQFVQDSLVPSDEEPANDDEQLAGGPDEERTHAGADDGGADESGGSPDDGDAFTGDDDGADEAGDETGEPAEADGAQAIDDVC